MQRDGLSPRQTPLPFSSPSSSSSSSSRSLFPSHVRLSVRKTSPSLALARCRKWGGLSGMGAVALEEEIFEFMEKSSKPGSFPTKEELIAAERMDLVEAIAEHGGWLAFGWDLDDDDGIRSKERGNSAEEEGGIEGILSALKKERIFTNAEADNRSRASFKDRKVQLNQQMNESISDQTKQGSPIISDIQQLESELNSVLSSLGSPTSKPSRPKTQLRGGSKNELDKLSDEIEFKETEISKVQDKVRSVRAKLAELEGIMALRTLEAAKKVEEKQKRINAAEKAIRNLSSAYLVWPCSGSEVFLAGSYDGWTSKRKMEKSSSGVFSLQLRLYPGQYEIKFIVDGVWRVDPLRPIAYHSGNNLLIIQ